MTNPFELAYLLSASSTFGPLAWIFLALQIGAVGVGAYLAYLRKDSNRIRRAALTRLGGALLALGAIGMAVATLRLNAIEPFTQRYWVYLVAALEVALAGYAFYYARAVYPTRLSHSTTSRGRVRPDTPRVAAASTNGSSHGSDDEPLPRGGRRESRRNRKRRSR